MTAKYQKLNVERLRELFSYDAASGVMYRTKTYHHCNAGKPAGTKFSTGHLNVSVDGRMTGVHRIAWAIHHGIDPVGQIDHINGDGADNRLCNLRIATSAQNNQNRRLSATRNKTGIKCVFRVKWNKDTRWRVGIGHSQGKQYVAHFVCFARAVKHANEMRAKLHHEFARAA